MMALAGMQTRLHIVFCQRTVAALPARSSTNTGSGPEKLTERPKLRKMTV